MDNKATMAAEETATPDNWFTDTAGRRWVCNVTIDTVRRLRDSWDLNVYALVEDNAAVLQRLFSDIVLFVDVIWETVHGQHDCDAKSFSEALSGDVLDAAQAAWLEGVVRFFPKASQRRALRLAIVKMTRLGEALVARGQAEMEAIDEARISTIADQVKDSYSNSPES